MDLARRIALLGGLALLGSFIAVMAVHFLLPVDPLNAEPLINYRVLFIIVFITFVLALTITQVLARRFP
ncbi:MAG: hypothetical protein F4W90_12320 [Gammaproteobacteria bacterium]|nr:hypothetical protein [Gammaproteobacteria bacterium]